jgi:hypothetical protein
VTPIVSELQLSERYDNREIAQLLFPEQAAQFFSVSQFLFLARTEWLL